MKDKFDYIYLGTCQYEDFMSEHGGDCGEPAVARGWWCGGHGTVSKEIYLCMEHLKFILKMEANDKP